MTPLPDIGELERPNVFEVDLGAVAHNAQLLRSQVHGAKIFAALKADAYGYGANAVARTLSDCGIDGFSMVSVGMAARLRGDGITTPILLYPGVPFTTAAAEAISRFDLTPTITDRLSADQLAAVVSGPVIAYLKVDVGLERFGVQAEDAESLLEHIETLPQIRIGGVYAHLHIPAKGWDKVYLDWQQSRFKAAVSAVSRRSLSPLVVMTASTGVFANNAANHVEAADPGRWFFGLVDADERKDSMLWPAFRSLRSQLVAVKDIRRSDFVDRSPLGRTDVRRIGIIPVGQVDGIERVTVGRVLVRGRPAEILGVPSIEHTRVDLSAIADAVPGDPVILIGRQGGSSISPREVAGHHGVPFPCLLALRVGPTFRRHYVTGS